MSSHLAECGHILEVFGKGVHCVATINGFHIMSTVSHNWECVTIETY